MCKYHHSLRAVYFLLSAVSAWLQHLLVAFFPSHWILVVKWYVFFSFSHASCYSFRSSECTVWFSIYKILGSLTTSWDIMRRQHKATFLVSIYRSQNKHSVGTPAIKQLVTCYTYTGNLASLAFAGWRESSSLEEMLSQVSISLNLHADQFSLQDCFISLSK